MRGAPLQRKAPRRNPRKSRRRRSPQQSARSGSHPSDSPEFPTMDLGVNGLDSSLSSRSGILKSDEWKAETRKPKSQMGRAESDLRFQLSDFRCRTFRFQNSAPSS